jgi:hypothetical protein
MSSTDVFYAIGDGAYWLFQNTLEPIGETFWFLVLILGFVSFFYWMYRQAQFNKMAENDPNQLK